MRVVTAKTAGFCMGVRRAVEMALQAARTAPKPVRTWGPLIHNRQVTEALQREGVSITESVPTDGGTVIIRAHGVTPEVLRQLQEAGVRVLDATCPHVLASQRNIRKASEEGLLGVIAGDAQHPEVLGLAGHCLTPVTILSTLADARMFSPAGAFFLLAQTTFQEALYQEITTLLRESFPTCRVYDSICDATSQRQREARQLAEQLRALVVAGDPHSANTRRLAEVGRETGARVWQIEEAALLPEADLYGLAEVGLTAGASTPDGVIDAIRQRLQRL